MRFSTAASGTCLTRTQIFKGKLLQRVSASGTRILPGLTDESVYDFEGAAHPGMDAAEVGVLARRQVARRRGDRIGVAAVDRVVAQRARVPDAVRKRVVARRSGRCTATGRWSRVCRIPASWSPLTKVSAWPFLTRAGAPCCPGERHVAGHVEEVRDRHHVGLDARALVVRRAARTAARRRPRRRSRSGWCPKGRLGTPSVGIAQRAARLAPAARLCRPALDAQPGLPLSEPRARRLAWPWPRVALARRARLGPLARLAGLVDQLRGAAPLGRLLPRRRRSPRGSSRRTSRGPCSRRSPLIRILSPLWSGARKAGLLTSIWKSSDNGALRNSASDFSSSVPP